MKYDRSEAIRYMGGRAGDENAGVLADLAYLKLRNEVQARSVYRVLDCSVDADGVLLGGEYFKSTKLAAHIKGCKRAVLLAATLGPKVDSCILNCVSAPAMRIGVWLTSRVFWRCWTHPNASV